MPMAIGANGSCPVAGSSVGRTRATRRRARRVRSSGLDLADWRALGTVEAYGYGKQTTVICFEALSPGRALTVDRGEIEEARWFALADPPVPLGLDAHVVLTRLLSAPASD